MVLTALPLLQKVSYLLKETTTDTSVSRISSLDQAIRAVLGEHKWRFKLKLGNLILVASTQTYDLTSASVLADGDYDLETGIFEVWDNTTAGSEGKIDPVHYDRKEETDVQKIYLTPDNKTLGFTKGIVGTENYDVWYYAQHKDLASSTATLNVPIPEAFIQAIALYCAKLVHDGKRQRYDSRNKMLEYQEEISKLRLKASGNKIKDLPKTIPTVFQYTGFRRSYRY